MDQEVLGHVRSRIPYFLHIPSCAPFETHTDTGESEAWGVSRISGGQGQQKCVYFAENKCTPPTPTRHLLHVTLAAESALCILGLVVGDAPDHSWLRADTLALHAGIRRLCTLRTLLLGFRRLLLGSRFPSLCLFARVPGSVLGFFSRAFLSPRRTPRTSGHF